MTTPASAPAIDIEATPVADSPSQRDRRPPAVVAYLIAQAAAKRARKAAKPGASAYSRQNG